MTDNDTDSIRRCPVTGCRGPDGKPRHLTGDQAVCPACDHRGRDNLLALPQRYVALRIALHKGAGGPQDAGRNANPLESTPPVRTAVLTAMDDLTRWATALDADIRRTLTLPVKDYRHMRGAQRLVMAVTSLSVQWPRAMHYRVAAHLIDGTTHWRARTDHLLGWDRLTHRLPAPCPYCDLMTLVRDDGADYVRCRACRRTWTEVEYRHFVRMLVDEHR